MDTGINAPPLTSRMPDRSPPFVGVNRRGVSSVMCLAARQADVIKTIGALKLRPS